MAQTMLISYQHQKKAGCGLFHNLSGSQDALSFGHLYPSCPADLSIPLTTLGLLYVPSSCGKKKRENNRFKL